MILFAILLLNAGLALLSLFSFLLLLRSLDDPATFSPLDSYLPLST